MCSAVMQNCKEILTEYYKTSVSTTALPIWLISCLCTAMSFSHYKMVWGEMKEYFVACETCIKVKCQCPEIAFRWNGALLFSLWIVCGYFHAEVVQVGSLDRDHVHCKPEILSMHSFTEILCSKEKREWKGNGCPWFVFSVWITLFPVRLHQWTVPEDMHLEGQYTRSNKNTIAVGTPEPVECHENAPATAWNRTRLVSIDEIPLASRRVICHHILAHPWHFIASLWRPVKLNLTHRYLSFPLGTEYLENQS